MIVVGTCDDALLAALRAEGLDTVEGAFAWDRGEDLDKPGLAGRRRTRIELTDAAGKRRMLYLKRYEGRRRRSWRTLGLRCRLAHGRRCTPARVEFANIRAAREAGVPTMREVLFGEQDASGCARSFLIVTAVPGDALERCAEAFLASIERDGGIGEFTSRLAGLVASLHASGYVHRDLYTSHIFLHRRPGGCDLYLIDLARMFVPLWRRFRWRVKDLAQLKYSMPSGWVTAHWDDFLAAYLGDAGCVRRYNRAVARKVAAMARRRERRRARLAAPEGPE